MGSLSLTPRYTSLPDSAGRSLLAQRSSWDPGQRPDPHTVLQSPSLRPSRSASLCLGGNPQLPVRVPEALARADTQTYLFPHPSPQFPDRSGSPPPSSGRLRVPGAART